jgi:hypothetical protein
MSSLREIQQRCYRAFVFGEADDLVPALIGTTIPASAQIQVYQNNARETYRKALLASFPVVGRLVGEDCFAGLAVKYMRQFPSEQGDLSRFGAAFADFLQALYGASEFAYLPDVARLEWALEEVHLEPDQAQLDAEALGGVDPLDHGRLTFSLRRATRLVDSHYPILTIWRANQPDRSGDADLGSGAEPIAVLRRGDDVELHRLNRTTWQLASQFARGTSLERAFEAIGGGGAGRPSAPDLAAALRTLIGLGLIAAFSLDDPNK